MSYLRSYLIPLITSHRNSKTTVAALACSVLLGLSSVAQEQPPASQDHSQPTQTQAEISSTVTLPSGTRLALVLTQPVQSRYVRRGDDVYAQITAPVNSGDQMVIPPGTFVQGTVDRVGRNGGRGELRLQSMSITFADGFVTPIAGPITIQTDEGYAIKDPGKNRVLGAFALPAARMRLTRGFCPGL